MLGISGVKATDINLTPSSGSYGANSGWKNTWTVSTYPSITITASANNMDASKTSEYLDWRSGGALTSTYTITVGNGCAINGYTITGIALDADQTLTAGKVTKTITSSSSDNFVVTGLSTESTSFTLTGSNTGLKVTSIVVSYTAPTDEQLTAFNTAKGWISSIQTAEGLVTDASNYSGNAIIVSGDGGGLPALLDNNTTTYCHTAYSSSGVPNPNADHYIQAYIGDGTDAFYLYTYKRNDNNRPTQIDITASNDGSDWTDITSLTSGLTTNASYLSGKISLGNTYKYIRFTVPTTNTGAKYGDHVFFTYSEFWLLPSKSYVDDAIDILNSLTVASNLSSDDIDEIGSVDLAIRTATIAPWKAAFIASAGESSNFGKAGWPSASAYTTFCNAVNALTVDDDYETEAATAMATLWGTVTYPATGYYYLHNKGTGRYAFSDEDVSTSQDYLNDESRTSKYIWKVTLDGSNVKIYSLTGHGITLDNNGGQQTGNIALETPDANNYTAARGAFYVGSIQDPNQASFTKNGTAYVSATNPMKLTHWNGGSGPNKGDRQGGKAYWIFEPIDVSTYDVYTVNFVDAPSNNYVTYTGAATTGNTKVWDGGQYFMTKDATVATSDFTPESVTGYDAVVTISSKTITVTYTITDYEALITAYFDTDKQTNFVNAGKVGYMQNTGDDFTNLKNLILTFAEPGHVYTESDYNNLITYYEACAANVKYPETSKFYLVKNNYNNKYMRVVSSNKGGVLADLTAEEAAKDASAHFRFVEHESHLYLSSQGQYLNWVYPDAGYEAQTSANFDKYVHFANPAVGLIAFSIAYGNGEGAYAGYLNLGYYSLFNEETKVVGGSNGYANSKAQWVFEEVNTMSIDLHSDGAGTPTYYATLCLPFDVTITDGADAYTLSASGQWLVPAAVEDNEVPAGTPVLLKGTNGSTATATINTGSAFNGGSPLDSDLTGTYFATTISGTNDYVLGINEGIVGFYHWNSNNLAANRAYVQAAAGVKGLAINWGEADGIQTIGTSAKATEKTDIYNLAGQRISKLQRGVNIVNGKKVVIK